MFCYDTPVDHRLGRGTGKNPLQAFHDPRVWAPKSQTCAISKSMLNSNTIKTMFRLPQIILAFHYFNLFQTSLWSMTDVWHVLRIVRYFWNPYSLIPCRFLWKNWFDALQITYHLVICDIFLHTCNIDCMDLRVWRPNMIHKSWLSLTMIHELFNINFNHIILGPPSFLWYLTIRLFLATVRQVILDSEFIEAAWVIKVDPDTVWSPLRLRPMLQDLSWGAPWTLTFWCGLLCWNFPFHSDWAVFGKFTCLFFGWLKVSCCFGEKKAVGELWSKPFVEGMWPD